MSRLYNFSAGPATLPTEVVEQARDDLLDWHGLGASVMEISHRGKDFMGVATKAEADLRELLAIPDQYKVLFLQGGGRGQFAAIPMNLLRGKTTADYVHTGSWAKIAIAEAKRYCDVNVVASAEEGGFNAVPDQGTWQCNPDAAYLYMVDNETIGGVEYPFIPETGNVPLVTDMSSNILSRAFDVSRFGLVFATAQKNIGIAGLTLVIVHEDLIGNTLPTTPSLWDYQLQSDAGSMLNTPPTFAWYLSGLIFDWVKRQGGVKALEEINQRKASKLYDMIDASDFYHNPVDPVCRSRMNVVFTFADAALEGTFLEESAKAGLIGLKGHRSVGGMRASIYNAMPESGVNTLMAFMQEFERKYG